MMAVCEQRSTHRRRRPKTLLENDPEHVELSWNWHVYIEESEKSQCLGRGFENFVSRTELQI